MAAEPTAVITVSAVVVRRAGGAVLTVRKRGTAAFMLPGGKPEPGESPRQTASREFAEELGVRLDPEALRPLGEFRTRAANEADTALVAHVFAAELARPEAVAVAAEIEELAWVDPAAGRRDPRQAPLNRELIFPLLVAAG